MYKKTLFCFVDTIKKILPGFFISFSAMAQYLAQDLIYCYPEVPGRSSDYCYSEGGGKGSLDIIIQTPTPPKLQNPMQHRSQLMRESINRVNNFISSQNTDVYFQSIKVGDEISQNLKNSFSANLVSKGFALSWKDHVSDFIWEIEPRIRSIFNESDLIKSQDEDWKSGFFSGWFPGEKKLVQEYWSPDLVESMIQEHIFKAEYDTYQSSFNIVNDIFKQSWSSTQNKFIALNEQVQNAHHYFLVDVPLPELDQETILEYYNTNIEDILQKTLEMQYAEHELALVEKPVVLEESSYQFLSPEGAFLDKNKELYLKALNAHPYHEQGRVAKSLSFSALETADEEYTQGDTESAELMYKIGSALMLNIDDSLDLSVLDLEEFNQADLLSQGKDIYEVLLGKRFLTARFLTNFERALLLLSFTLSFFKESDIKNSLNTAGKTLSKIHARSLRAETKLLIQKQQQEPEQEQKPVKAEAPLPAQKLVQESVQTREESWQAIIDKSQSILNSFEASGLKKL